MRRNIRLGPGAASLILLVVVLCMSVLGMLTLMSARNDARLSGRSAEVAHEVSLLYTQSERDLAALDEVLSACAKDAAGDDIYLENIAAALPEGMELDGREVVWTAAEDERTLSCAAQIAPLGSFPRAEMTKCALLIETEDEWNW